MIWFTFAGVDSRDKGVYLAEPLIVPTAERQVRFKEISGRSGSLAIDEGGYRDISRPLVGHVRAGANLDEVRAWLQGAGELILSHEPGATYRARVDGEVEFVRPVRGMSAREIEAPLVIKPFRYLHPAASDIEIAASPYTIINPGTYKAEPRIRIEGSGDVVLTIGTQIVEIEGMEDGVIIDSELMECLNLTETAFLNRRVTVMDDEFPTLAPGANIVSWAGEGSVTKVTITPRWRYL